VSHRASGSKTDLLLECQYWARGDVEVPADEAGQPAKDGNATHAIAEAFLLYEELTVEDACKKHGGDPDRVNTLWQSAYPAYRSFRGLHGGLATPEVAFVYSTTDSVWELERSEHRDYGVVRANEIPATADIVIAPAHQGEPPTVIDLKTGDPESLPLPERSGQLRTLGLMVARSLGASEVVVGFVIATDDGQSARLRFGTLDALDLEMHEARLTAALEAIPNAQPKPGPHCDYCPARTCCPATVRALASVAELPVADIEKIAASSIQTPEDAGKAYVRLKVLKDAVRAVESRIKEVVEQQGPAPSRPGKKLVLASKSRETFSQERLRTRVSEPEKVLDLLREAGAIQTSSWTELREVKESA